MKRRILMIGIFCLCVGFSVSVNKRFAALSQAFLDAEDGLEVRIAVHHFP